MALAARTADRVAPCVGSDPDAAEMYGMLHLTCALNAAALRSPAESADHQAEAADVAARVGSGTNFGHQGFGLVNYGFWEVHLAVERGEGGKVRELARGRGLATERAYRQEAVVALRTAERWMSVYPFCTPFYADYMV
jgi:hypothetical protein